MEEAEERDKREMDEDAALVEYKESFGGFPSDSGGALGRFKRIRRSANMTWTTKALGTTTTTAIFGPVEWSDQGISNSGESRRPNFVFLSHAILHNKFMIKIFFFVINLQTRCNFGNERFTKLPRSRNFIDWIVCAAIRAKKKKPVQCRAL